jgi:hypothetical protein
MDSHARPVTCIFAVQRHARDGGANARNKKAALPRPFELIALNWEWSYGDSNPGPLACHEEMSRPWRT